MQLQANCHYNKYLLGSWTPSQRERTVASCENLCLTSTNLLALSVGSNLVAQRPQVCFYFPAKASRLSLFAQYKRRRARERHIFASHYARCFICYQKVKCPPAAATTMSCIWQQCLHVCDHSWFIFVYLQSSKRFLDQNFTKLRLLWRDTHFGQYTFSNLHFTKSKWFYNQITSVTHPFQ